ncbi:MAG: hypothetical protein Q8O38_05700 [Sulfurimicrobium sp.]|nr:hypothetical protein [Sulfurimicrobium sp.]
MKREVTRYALFVNLEMEKHPLACSCISRFTSKGVAKSVSHFTCRLEAPTFGSLSGAASAAMKVKFPPAKPGAYWVSPSKGRLSCLLPWPVFGYKKYC